MTTTNQKTIYLPDEQIEKLNAIQQTLSTNVGIRLSVSAVISRAIDDLFLSVCLSKETNVLQKSNEVAR